MTRRDQVRTYHLVTLFVVSRRTQHEYAQAFGCIIGFSRRLFHTDLHVGVVMGDAEDTQFNALRSLPDFSESKYLICYFHVLYNAYKETRHLDEMLGVNVFKGIIDMHYTLGHGDICKVCDNVITKWNAEPHLQGFTSTFRSSS